MKKFEVKNMADCDYEALNNEPKNKYSNFYDYSNNGRIQQWNFFVERGQNTFKV